MLASRSSWARFGAGTLACGALIVAAQGCTVDVSLAFDTCEVGGVTYDVGESFTAPDGCNTCTCGSDGNASCTALGCVDTCDYAGVTYAVGESFPADDGCNTCSCTEGGNVACTEIACTGCEVPPPDCVQPGAPNCSAQAVCDPMLGWQCVINCDECTGGPPPCAAPPPGCTSNGPVCVDGNWQCGVIECSGSCYYAGEVHQPGEIFPDLDGCNQCTCLPDGSVACTDMACPSCNTTPPSCTSPDPSCTAYPVCIDGTNWDCQIDCVPDFCLGPKPVCPLGPPNCTYDAVCSDMGWECQAFCLPSCPGPTPICGAPMGCQADAVCGMNGWECQVACP